MSRNETFSAARRPRLDLNAMKRMASSRSSPIILYLTVVDLESLGIENGVEEVVWLVVLVLMVSYYFCVMIIARP